MKWNFWRTVEELFPQDESQLSAEVLQASLCSSAAYSAGGFTSQERGLQDQTFNYCGREGVSVLLLPMMLKSGSQVDLRGSDLRFSSYRTDHQQPQNANNSGH